MSQKKTAGFVILIKHQNIDEHRSHLSFSREKHASLDVSDLQIHSITVHPAYHIRRKAGGHFQGVDHD
jgi:hypothetical protein